MSKRPTRKSKADDQDRDSPSIVPHVQVLRSPFSAHRKFSDRRRNAVLEVLAQGLSYARAAQAAGVTRTTVFDWRKQDADFDAACLEAYEAGVDLLEEEAMRRAYEGVTKPVFQGGECVGHVQEYSDNLMIMMLKGRRKTIYGDSVSASLSGSISLTVSPSDKDL